MVLASKDDTVSNITHICASPVISSDKLFILGHNSKLKAMHLKSGEPIWDVPLSGINTPAVVGNWLFAINSNGIIFCFEKNTGRLRWQTTFPEYFDEMQKARSDSKTDTKKANDKDENTKKRKKVKRPRSWTNPIVAGDSVILVSDLGDIFFFNAADGNLVRTIPSKIKSPSAAAVIDGVLLVLSSDGSLYAFGQKTTE
jgi:outer membrane protein assembly factor BamB